MSGADVVIEVYLSKVRPDCKVHSFVQLKCILPTFLTGVYACWPIGLSHFWISAARMPFVRLSLLELG